MVLAVLDHTARAIFYLLAVVAFVAAFVAYISARRARADGTGPLVDVVVGHALVAVGLALAFVPPMVDAFDAA